MANDECLIHFLKNHNDINDTNHLQSSVVWLGRLHARKQVSHDALKQRHILCQELGHISISQGMDEDIGFFCSTDVLFPFTERGKTNR